MTNQPADGRTDRPTDGKVAYRVVKHSTKNMLWSISAPCSIKYLWMTVLNEWLNIWTTEWMWQKPRSGNETARLPVLGNHGYNFHLVCIDFRLMVDRQKGRASKKVFPSSYKLFNYCKDKRRKLGMDWRIEWPIGRLMNHSTRLTL